MISDSSKTHRDWQLLERVTSLVLGARQWVKSTKDVLSRSNVLVNV